VVAARHRCLVWASKATMHRILATQPLQPHEVTQYLQRCDPAFKSKISTVRLKLEQIQLLTEIQVFGFIGKVEKTL
jgi:hypothetical protein